MGWLAADIDNYHSQHRTIQQNILTCVSSYYWRYKRWYHSIMENHVVFYRSSNFGIQKISLCERRWLIIITTTPSAFLALFGIWATLVSQMCLVAPCPPVSTTKHTPTTKLSFSMQGGLDCSRKFSAYNMRKFYWDLKLTYRRDPKRADQLEEPNSTSQ